MPRKRTKFVHGCPRCGGQIIRRSGFMTCKKCEWRQGEQMLGPVGWRTPPSTRTPPEELPVDHENPYPGKRRLPLEF